MTWWMILSIYAVAVVGVGMLLADLSDRWGRL